MAKEKPGVMLYWEVFDVLKTLQDAQAKTLLLAIREYSQNGEAPDFGEDITLSVVWTLIKTKLDLDSEKYERIREQRTNAINARWKNRKKDDTKDTRDTDEYGRIRNIPTTTTTSTTTTSTTTTIKEEKAPSKHKHGEYKNVLLTDEEFLKLQNEYADYSERIERLSSYIASTGKSYKSHYATIRNWARKDQEERNKPQTPYRKPNKADELNDFYNMAANWAESED